MSAPLRSFARHMDAGLIRKSNASPLGTHRFTTVLARHDLQCLLQRDGQYSIDAPWIHACGEDDEFFPFHARGEDDDFFPCHGGGDEAYEDYSCNVTVSIRITRRGSTPAARMTSSSRSPPSASTTMRWISPQRPPYPPKKIPAFAGIGSHLVAVRYSAARQIVGRHFDRHAIPFEYADAETSQLARDGRENCGTVVECHAERRARKNFGDGSFELYQVFFGDTIL